LSPGAAGGTDFPRHLSEERASLCVVMESGFSTDAYRMDGFQAAFFSARVHLANSSIFCAGSLKSTQHIVKNLI